MMNVTISDRSDEHRELPRLAYTLKETAAILGCSQSTVRRLEKRGLLRSNPALRTKIFARTEIERFLRS